MNMWKDWLYYSKRERNGISVLLLIFIIVLFARLFAPGKLHHNNYDYSSYHAIIDSFNQALYNDSVRTAQLWQDNFAANRLTSFNPNTSDSFQLRNMGFGLQSINNILNYRKAGGQFKEAHDLLRIYSISDTEFAQIAPFISIPKKQNVSKQTKIKHALAKISPQKKMPIIQAESNFIIELNKADTAELIQLKGIGSILAERIVKYRNWLGGYYSLTQLEEVYGLKPETIAKLSVHLSIDSTQITKININKASLSQIKRHPYLNFYQAKSIVDTRKKEGSFKDLEDVLSIPNLDTNQLSKAIHYWALSSSEESE